MDYADEDAVTRFERWEAALDKLQWMDATALDPDCSIAKAAMTLIGPNSITTMKREAIINAARIEGDAHLARVAKAFPGVDVLALVQALRVKFVEMRLEER